jgi:hypothetical protein
MSWHSSSSTRRRAHDIRLFIIAALFVGLRLGQSLSDGASIELRHVASPPDLADLLNMA